MKKIGLAFGFVVLSALGCSSADTEESAPIARPQVGVTTPQGFSLGGGARQLVVFKSSTLPGDAAARIAKAGGKTKASLASIGVAIVEADAAAIAKLVADGSVAAVGAELTWKLPATKYKKTQPAPASPAPDFFWGAQWDQRHIKANVAWNNVPASAQANVTVAVLDTGVMSDHPDLLGKVVDSVATNFTNGVLNCQGPPAPDAGYPLYFTRINLVNGNLCEPVFDQDSVQGHGTHVAGTIGGNYGGGFLEQYGFPGGIVGVAPDAKIAAYKVFDRVVLPTPDGGGMEVLTATDEALFAAIADAASKHYAVINMSLGGVINRLDPAHNASWIAWNRVANLATKSGTLIVAAAGNDNANNNGSLAFIPSDLPGVLAVAATGTNNMQGEPFSPFPYGGSWNAAPGSDVRAEYSNFGAAVNVAAPGGDCGPAFVGTPESCDPRHLIVSSVPFWDASTGEFGAGWEWNAGTSMASPHVAGVAALVKAKNPGFSPVQIRARIEQTATAIGSRQAFGRGLVNADLATR